MCSSLRIWRGLATGLCLLKREAIEAEGKGREEGKKGGREGGRRKDERKDGRKEVRPGPWWAPRRDRPSSAV